jgi:hypothetical protein
MARQLSNWIASYLQMVDETEPAQRFHFWTAVTILGAALARKCEIQLGPKVFFPNLYTVLVGPPAVRKGDAISYGVELLDAVEAGSITRGPDAVTKEQLLVEMERTQRTENIEGRLFTHSSLLVVASELINFIKENDYERLGYLCQLYDGLSRFEYKTKTSVNVYAVNPGLWILGATTPNWIEIAMKQLGVGGGITSRTIFVFSSRKARHIPLTEMKPFDQELRGKLIADLAMIKSMAGRFQLTDEAKTTYASWYGWDGSGSREAKKGKYRETRIEDGRLESYWGRLPSMVMKVAMIISAAKRDDKVVHSADIIQAIRAFEHIHPEMPQAFGGLGYNVLGNQTEMVRNILREKGTATKSHIMRTLRMHISEWDYQRIKMSLIAEKFCNRDFDKAAGEEVLICQEKLAQTPLETE